LSPLEATGLTAFILIVLLGLFSTMFGLPGTVLILGASIVYALATGFQAIGLKIICILILISIAAESLEFLMGLTGAGRIGSSRGGTTASLLGAAAGAALLTPFLFGLGTLMGALLGGISGLLIVEINSQWKLKPAARDSYKTLLGRVMGLFAKSFFALIMVVIVLTAIYS